MPTTKTTAAKQKNARPSARKRSVATVRTYKETTTVATASLVDVDKPLTDMQRLFVKHWASGESILSASVRAGYADGGTFAYRMAHMPNILRAYNEEKLAYERDSGMNRKRVIDGLLEGIEMAKLVEEPASVIGGWREIGKLCGYYEPVKVRHEVSVQGKILVDRLANMSDEELFKIIEERAAQMRQLQTTEGDSDDGAAP